MLTKECCEAEREWIDAKALQEMDGKIRKFESYGAWRHVYDLEARLETTQKKLIVASKDRDGTAEKSKQSVVPRSLRPLAQLCPQRELELG
jgi:hypothetical protein